MNSKGCLEAEGLVGLWTQRDSDREQKDLGNGGGRELDKTKQDLSFGLGFQGLYARTMRTLAYTYTKACVHVAGGVAVEKNLPWDM